MSKLLLLLLLFPHVCFSFSGFGHRLICAAAYEMTTPNTKVFIDKLVNVKGEAKGAGFVKGCTWPDVV
jgi:hypothetical protein